MTPQICCLGGHPTIIVQQAVVYSVKNTNGSLKSSLDVLVTFKQSPSLEALLYTSLFMHIASVHIVLCLSSPCLTMNKKTTENIFQKLLFICWHAWPAEVVLAICQETKLSTGAEVRQMFVGLTKCPRMDSRYLRNAGWLPEGGGWIERRGTEVPEKSAFLLQLP